MASVTARDRQAQQGTAAARPPWRSVRERAQEVIRHCHHESNLGARGRCTKSGASAVDSFGLEWQARWLGTGEGGRAWEDSAADARGSRAWQRHVLHGRAGGSERRGSRGAHEKWREERREGARRRRWRGRGAARRAGPSGGTRPVEARAFRRRRASTWGETAGGKGARGQIAGGRG